MIKIHDYVSVNSEKEIGIEKGLDVLHCVPDKMRSGGRMYSNIVAKRLEPQNISYLDQDDSTLAFCGKAVQELTVFGDGIIGTSVFTYRTQPGPGAHNP